MSVYARTNEYGFIETPCRKVVNGRATEEIEYLSAIEEVDQYIAQSNIAMDEKGNITADLVPCRHENEFSLTRLSARDVGLEIWKAFLLTARDLFLSSGFGLK